MVQLLDPAVPLACLDQGFAKRAMRLRIVRIVGDPGLELLDRGWRRRGLDVREHQGGWRICRADHAFQSQIDEGRTPRLRDGRVLLGLEESPRRRDVFHGEGLIVHLVAGLRTGRIEVGLELERRHLHHGLPLGALRRGRRPRRRRALRHDRLDLGRLRGRRVQRRGGRLGAREPGRRPDARASRWCAGHRGRPPALGHHRRDPGRCRLGRRGERLLDLDFMLQHRLELDIEPGLVRVGRHRRLELRYRRHGFGGHLVAQ